MSNCPFTRSYCLADDCEWWTSLNRCAIWEIVEKIEELDKLSNTLNQIEKLLEKQRS